MSMYPPPQVEIKESLPGIISTVIALLLGALSIALILLAVYLETTTAGGIDEDSPSAIGIGLGLFAIAPLSFIGAILGFIGLFQKNRRRTFPVFGAFLNLALLCGLIGLILFSLVMG